MKYLFLLPFFFMFTICSAQTPERKEIHGDVTVPKGYDPDGIHIFNKTSGYGTTSDSDGSFKLEMAAGDTLFFSAVQFEPLEVQLEQEIIDSGYLLVEISEGLNELPEIIIRPHNLFQGSLVKTRKK